MTTPERAETLVGSARLDVLLQEAGEQAVPIVYEELQNEAQRHLDAEAFDYVAGGAGGEHTVTGNRQAFEAWRIRPRMLRGVSTVDLGIEVLGSDYQVPLWLAPIGAQTIAHEDGEVATAHAVADFGVPMMVSCVASKTLESVAEYADDAPCWFQLYPSVDWTITRSLVSRAEEAGYEGIVVTVDTPAYAWRERDLSNAFHPQVAGHQPANYFTDPAFRAGLNVPPEDDPDAAYERFGELFTDPDLNWEDIGELTRLTDLPIFLKGILRGDDARRAVDHGVDGVVVSNHGGRQVDRAIASLDALPEVRKAVGDDFPIILDGGVRRGSEVFVALALGADVVCIGRPYLYGLAVAGTDGVAGVVANLLTDLRSTLAQTGHARTTAVKRDAIRRQSN